MSFPTGLISLLKKKCTDNTDESFHYKNCDENFINRLDKAAYWLFIIGIYPGHNNVTVRTEYNASIGILYIGLFLEKAAISWLKNRWGCDYFYF